jgi:hypothetical protein
VCGRDNFGAWITTCLQCSASRESGRPYVLPQPIWVCSLCGVSNWENVKRCRNCGRERALAVRPFEIPFGEVVIRNYPGRTQADAAVLFANDAQQLSEYGYQPISQSWADGRPSTKRIVAIGLFSLVARPPGTLTVTYRKAMSVPMSAAPEPEKTCPRCAERVKEAAVVCRFCGHEFT